MLNTNSRVVLPMLGLAGTVAFANPATAAMATAAADISTIPKQEDSQAVKATAFLDGSVSDPTTIVASAFADADLADGSLKALSRVSIDPYDGGLVVSSTANAFFEDVLTFQRQSGSGEWFVALPVAISLGPGGFSGSAEAFFSANLSVTGASGSSYSDFDSTFTIYRPDTFATDQKVFPFEFTIPAAVTTVEVALDATLNTFANACVPSAGFPDACADAGQTSDPVADFASSANFSVETSLGVAISSESGQFLAPVPVPAALPLLGSAVLGLLAAGGRRYRRSP